MVRKGPLPEHDLWRAQNATSKRKIAISNMPHLVCLDGIVVGQPNRIGLMNFMRPMNPELGFTRRALEFWYGFDDFDEAVLFMLKN